MLLTGATETYQTIGVIVYGITCLRQPISGLMFYKSSSSCWVRTTCIWR